MNTLALIGAVLGGIGLLLVGMAMMTEGLKLAAGKALRNILATWTRGRARGLGAGFLITGMVQSSSAVTVATIGFANAGLLTLPAALWVVYGSNVGTTMTGWIVALIGFKLKVEAFALPMVGIGVLLRLTGEGTRRAFIGQAIVGFGLLFLGIGVLADTFTSLGEDFRLPVITEPWLWAVLVYIGVGVLLTTLMQSSSAALVIALSAAQSGLVPLETAAMVVIGANLGTTTTALISVWGATPVAKRVALGHVLFNVLTAAVAVVILVPLLALVGAIRGFLHLEPSPAVTLALFHTVFNALGVALMWPISARIERFLNQQFQTEEETASRPRYLDRNVLALPDIAMQALIREVGRIRELTVTEFGKSLAGVSTDGHEQSKAVAQSLSDAVGDYVAALNRTALPADIAAALPDLLQSTERFNIVLHTLPEIDRLQNRIVVPAPQPQQALDAFRDAVTRLLPGIAMPGGAAADGTGAESSVEIEAESVALLETRYDALRQEALAAAAHGHFSASAMTDLLRFATLLRRMLKQTRRAASALDRLQESLDVKPATEAADAIEEAAAA